MDGLGHSNDNLLTGIGVNENFPPNTLYRTGLR